MKFHKGEKPKRTTAAVAPTPRALEVIMNDYNQLKSHAGDIQYQIYALETTLEQMNQQMYALNSEGGARKKLDAEAAAKTTEAANENT